MVHGSTRLENVFASSGLRVDAEIEVIVGIGNGFAIVHLEFSVSEMREDSVGFVGRKATANVLTLREERGPSESETDCFGVVLRSRL